MEGSYNAPPARARSLYVIAMAVFVITVSVGILNGLKLVEFDRAQLLTHVHAGTLGWITIGVLATALWMLSGPAERVGSSVLRAIVWAAVVTIPILVGAFATGDLTLRAIFSWPVFVVTLGMVWWAIGATRREGLTLPRLGMVLALITLFLGSAIGVILASQQALQMDIISAAAIGGHVSAQLVGYLVLFAMAVTEWRLRPDASLSRWGIAQYVIPFIGAVIGIFGATAGSNEALGAVILFELVGVAIYTIRLAPQILGVPWLRAEPARHFAIAVPFLIADLGFLIVLIYGVVSGTYADFLAIPIWLVFAFDHAMFVGVVSNVLFGLVQVATWEQRRVGRWADHVVFWGMNAGMLGFVVSLALEQRDLERIFAPVMGVSILVGIVVYAWRIVSPRTMAVRSVIEAS